MVMVKKSIALIKNMLSDMCLHPENPDPKVMNLENIGIHNLIGMVQLVLGHVEGFLVLEIGTKFPFKRNA